MQYHIRPGSSVLDVGYGPGDLLASVKPSEGWGVDISDKSIDIARSKYPEQTRGRCTKPFRSKSFDYVILSDSARADFQ